MKAFIAIMSYSNELCHSLLHVMLKTFVPFQYIQWHCCLLFETEGQLVLADMNCLIMMTTTTMLLLMMMMNLTLINSMRIWGTQWFNYPSGISYNLIALFQCCTMI